MAGAFSRLSRRAWVGEVQVGAHLLEAERADVGHLQQSLFGGDG
jgi:hypothetical protein